jgi:hypothetical protein
MKIRKQTIMEENIHTKFKYFVILSGILLAVVTELKGSHSNLWYVLWAIFPYAAYGIAASIAKSIGAITGGGLLILGVDILVHVQVFYFPKSSTDSISLLVMPFWQSVLIMPIGFLFGWFIEKTIRRHKK